jgi:hypothetical protein
MPELPPLSPDGEVVVHDETPFTSACLGYIREIPFPKDWSVGTPYVTRNDIWGLVFRADMHIPLPADLPGVNRITCVQRPSGEISFHIAIGQDLAPLDASNSAL